MKKIDQVIEQIKQYKQPPVDRWEPDYVGEIDIVIDRHGQWFHEGGLIQRQELIKLFSSVLWEEAGQYFLVTPVEKLAIKVEDVPFIIQQAELVQGGWAVTDNAGHACIIDESHTVQLRQYQQQWVPYVNLRYSLLARVSRSVYMQWVECAMEQSEQAPWQLTSAGYVFEVAKQ